MASPAPATDAVPASALAPWRPIAAHCAALLASLAVSLLITWPLPTILATHVIGRNTGDAMMNVWNMWWVARAVSRAQSPFWTDMLYFPDGAQLYVQTMNPLNGLLTLPVTQFAGPVAAYNAALLLALTLTGYGTCLLVRSYVPGWAIPWLCGTLVAADPFMLMRIDAGQSNLIAIQWLPFLLLALHHLEGPHHRRAILGAIAACVLIVLTEWYYALVAAALITTWALAALLTRPQQRSQLLARFLTVAAGAALALTPLFIGMARVRHALPATDGQPGVIWSAYVRGFSADALALAFPAIFQPLWGAAMAERLAPLGVGTFAMEGWYVASGWVLLGSAIVGAAAVWRAHPRLLVVGAVLWLLSLGPTARVAGLDTGLPLLYGAVERLPLLSAARRPALFAVGCLFLIAIAAGLGLQRLTAGRTPTRRAALLIGVAVIGALELCPPAWPTTTFPASAVYERLRDAPPGAVADLPLEWTESSRSLRNQIVHGHPILGVYLARWAAYPALEYNPLLGQVAAMRQWPVSDIVPLGHEALAAMQCAFPIRHVVVDTDRAGAQSQAELVAVLATLAGHDLPPVDVDASHRWYVLPVPSAPCRPYVALGADWFSLEHDGARRWRWMGPEATVWALNPGDTPRAMQLSISAASLADGAVVTLHQQDRPDAAWALTTAVRTYRVLLVLPPGATPLRLSAPTTDDPQGRRRVSVSVLDIALTPFGSAQPALDE